MTLGNPFSSKKEHKLTRRRIMKLASSAGFSTATVLNMTVEDVKASDSDQVTVSLDIGGNSKYTVDSDRIEMHQRTKSITKDLQDEYFHRDGILQIGRTGGDREDNPHVIVTLEENSNEADERRGELPEEKQDVRIETREGTREDGGTTCSPNAISASDDMPGGQQIQVKNNDGSFEGPCTISPQVIEGGYGSFGWSSASHCFQNCFASGDVQHTADGVGQYLGYPSVMDWDLDWAFIEQDGRSASGDNLHPETHTGVRIIDTIGEEGMAIIADEYDGESNYIHMFGIGSCNRSGELESWDENIYKGGNYDCQDNVYDQVTIDYGYSSHLESGDSGAIWYVEDPNNSGDNYAIGSTSGYEFTITGYINHGPQGYAVWNKHDRRWKGL